jgi:hypothetical protein
VKKIEDTDVEKIIDKRGNQIAISKSVFAGYICDEANNFNEFNFEEFSKLFDVIENIITI